MNQESLILGTLSGQLNDLAAKEKLSEFFRTLARTMTVNNPKSLIEAYGLIEDVCAEIREDAAGTHPAAASEIIDADEQQTAEGRRPAPCSIAPVIIAKESTA